MKTNSQKTTNIKIHKTADATHIRALTEVLERVLKGLSRDILFEVSDNGFITFRNYGLLRVIPGASLILNEAGAIGAAKLWMKQFNEWRMGQREGFAGYPANAAANFPDFFHKRLEYRNAVPVYKEEGKYKILHYWKVIYGLSTADGAVIVNHTVTFHVRHIGGSLLVGLDYHALPLLGETEETESALPLTDEQLKKNLIYRHNSSLQMYLPHLITETGVVPLTRLGTGVERKVKVKTIEEVGLYGVKLVLLLDNRDNVERVHSGRFSTTIYYSAENKLLMKELGYFDEEENDVLKYYNSKLNTNLYYQDFNPEFKGFWHHKIFQYTDEENEKWNLSFEINFISLENNSEIADRINEEYFSNHMIIKGSKYLKPSGGTMERTLVLQNPYCPQLMSHEIGHFWGLAHACCMKHLDNPVPYNCKDVLEKGFQNGENLSKAPIMSYSSNRSREIYPFELEIIAKNPISIARSYINSLKKNDSNLTIKQLIIGIKQGTNTKISGEEEIKVLSYE